MQKYLVFLKLTSFIRTFIINFKCLPFKQACKLPILLGHGTRLRSLKGKIIIEGPVRTGMISFGMLRIFRDDPHKRNYIDNNGTIIFKGHAIFHTGTILSVDKGAVLELGENFRVGADSVIYTKKSITFGNTVGISWNFQILDTDFHYIRNTVTGDTFPNTKSIVIGDRCWIGNHVCISKGTKLPNGTIVSARSLVNKKFETENTIIGGSPAKVLKENFERVFSYTEEREIDAKFAKDGK